MSEVHLCEVGPRDGLQNEKSIIPAADKIRFVELLARAGLREIEVTSFVSPKWVPQLADAEEVLAGVLRCASRTPSGDPIVLSALVPNEKGLERALACGVRKVSVSSRWMTSEQSSGAPAAAFAKGQAVSQRVALVSSTAVQWPVTPNTRSSQS